MKNLVIGSTSQLAHYFPEDYIKISSRNIDFDYLKNNQWNSVYITFAEQRIYDRNIDFITPNYLYTLQIIDSLFNNSNKIVCYGTCELWNNLSGKIDIFTKPDFDISNDYAISKFLLLKKVKENYSKYNGANIIFIHPFYFNSVYRSEYFLFGKIFKSIINKTKITVGNLDFYRDIVSPQFVVDKSIETNNDLMMGSGQLFHVGNFIKDLYKLNNLNFDELVAQDYSNFEKEYSISDLFCGINKKKEKLIMADVNYWQYTYQNLLDDTQKDILSMRNNGYNR